MRDTSPLSAAIVVSIDGSRGALGAAVWAVDEAMIRDVPLRLVYAIEPRDAGRLDGQCTTHDFAVAESAIRHAAMAVQSTNCPVRIEVEIVQGHRLRALSAASQSAPMLCVNDFAFSEAADEPCRSALVELLDASHCLLAIVNGGNPGHRAGSIVVEFDGSPASPLVVGHALDEARRRHAPLRVLDTGVYAEADDRADGQLHRILYRYREVYPRVDCEIEAAPGALVDYVTENRDCISLLVLSRDTAKDLAYRGELSLAELKCPMLIAPPYTAW